jgi:hypothetical protein
MTPSARLSLAVIAIIACTLTPYSSQADSPASIKVFEAEAAKGAAYITGLDSHKRGGCDVNALVGPVVGRSRESLLHVGDRILSVNGQAVQASAGGSPFSLINALPPNDKVTLGLSRGKSHLTVSIQCMNSADNLSVVIAAYDAAAAGKFAECTARASDYARSYVQQAFVYGLGRRCSILAGLTTGEGVYTTFLTYWTLRLQELKYHPESVDETRSEYLGAQTELQNSGQPLLVDELRRQWTLATGESTRTPPPESAKRVVALPNVPQRPLRVRASGSCEDGHWIEEVMGDGAIVKLEDGSLWQVDAADTVDSALWLPTTDIVVCDGKLINTEDNESVEAERVH